MITTTNIFVVSCGQKHVFPQFVSKLNYSDHIEGKKTTLFDKTFKSGIYTIGTPWRFQQKLGGGMVKVRNGISNRNGECAFVEILLLVPKSLDNKKQQQKNGTPLPLASNTTRGCCQHSCLAGENSVKVVTISNHPTSNHGEEAENLHYK